SVSFFDGTTLLGTVSLSSGKASLTRSFTALGAHNIVAVYNPNANFTGSSKAITEQVVALVPSQVLLTASVNSVPAGVPVTFTAGVSSGTGVGTPTGTITFMDGNVVLARVTLQNGQAALTTTFATTGSHTIRAVYSGDNVFASSLFSLILQVNV